MNILNETNIAAFQLSKMVASPWLNLAMQYIAESFLVVIPLLLIYMYLKKDKNVFSLVVLFFTLFVVGEVLKYIIQEKRPCSLHDLSWINYVGCESGYSFPSNHATVLTGISLFTLSYRYVRILYLVWLIFVLFGRIYLGQHYFTDVLAGVIISLAIAWPIYKYYSQKINGPLKEIFCKIFHRSRICK
ncbi:MAG: phosphatase PAP2 family protein [Candidatus Micrarchaeia archaeon]|jgi:undecaprenyl-diphosphatase